MGFGDLLGELLVLQRQTLVFLRQCLPQSTNMSVDTQRCAPFGNVTGVWHSLSLDLTPRCLFRSHRHILSPLYLSVFLSRLSLSLSLSQGRRGAVRETERFEKEGSEESHVVQLQRGRGGGTWGKSAHVFSSEASADVCPSRPTPALRKAGHRECFPS